MTVIETLLSRRWIVKAKERALYYQIKDKVLEVKKFVNEKLGYQLIVNPYVIKLEKTPAVAESWMGIQEFTENIHYEFLCLVLAFLEDKEVEEQFVLSQLTEFIEANDKEEKIDWTSYAYRRNLIRVLKFCIQNHFIIVNDGNEDSFRDSQDGEVLYENTGVSRYFMRNFARNIMNYQTVDDFGCAEWNDMEADRGIIRQQRVYQKLLMSPGIYKNGEDDEDFAYIKNYRNTITDNLQKFLDCELHVHKTSAYLILGEESSIGKVFPSANMLSDILLLVNHVIWDDVQEHPEQVRSDDRILMSIAHFEKLLERCKEQYGSGFNKNYREMTMTEFSREIMDAMEQNEFIEVNREYSEVFVRPIVGKIVGQFPKDFKDGGRISE